MPVAVMIVVIAIVVVVVVVAAAATPTRKISIPRTRKKGKSSALKRSVFTSIKGNGVVTNTRR